MTTSSFSAQLAEVQDAISRVLQSQEYTVANRTNKRAMLADLTKREQYLRRMVNRETAGGIRIRRGVFSNR